MPSSWVELSSGCQVFFRAVCWLVLALVVTLAFLLIPGCTPAASILRTHSGKVRMPTARRSTSYAPYDSQRPWKSELPDMSVGGTPAHKYITKGLSAGQMGPRAADVDSSQDPTPATVWPHTWAPPIPALTLTTLTSNSTMIAAKQRRSTTQPAPDAPGHWCYPASKGKLGNQCHNPALPLSLSRQDRLLAQAFSAYNGSLARSPAPACA